MTSSFETIPFGKEGKLSLSLTEEADLLELRFRMPGNTQCVLHWGLSRGPGTAWHVPPESSWPEGSSPRGPALQSPFVPGDGEASLTLPLRKPSPYTHVAFVLYFPETGKWENNGGKNFFVLLPLASPASEAPAAVLATWLGGREVTYEAAYETKEGERIATAVAKEEGVFHIFLVADIQGPLVLHWGVAEGSPYEWLPPPKELLPPGSVPFGEKACRTPFSRLDALNRLDFTVPEERAPAGIPFVLYQPDEERWIKDRGRNFYLRLRPTAREEASPLPAGLHELADAIIHAETGKGSWTLMHRFNLCHDLIERAGSVEGLALLLVWLRFSAIRQLDWQRNYNTKPRELSHAQDRLTRKIAHMYGRMGGSAEAQEFLRLMMASLGRGGEGQRVRDEILNIMHRHHIKEVAGHFMEEWHQKLHNNTTPDDMAICEAYLDFLRSDGQVDLFYRTLERQGVSRERMESFERPIVTPPDFVPHLKEALIHDFEDYLRLLKSVHSGTDLESAFHEARHLLGKELTDIIETIRRGKDYPAVGTSRLAGEITRARQRLLERLGGETDAGHRRDLLYLDLSLEEFFRVVIERSAGAVMDETDLCALVASAVRNVSCSSPEVEFDLSLSWWERLLSVSDLSRHSRDWALHARAVTERLGRALGSYMDRHHHLLQPMAEYLGGAFHADRWTITLFGEELVRGLPAFSLSQTLRRLDPLLRERAELGSWQVISPATASGRVRVVEDLRAVHAMDLDGPTIVLAGRVRGDEEPPPEVRAVITSQPTDIVSHVAVRARNSALLFAVCYDEECLEKLRSAEGRTLTLSVTNTGEWSSTRLKRPPPFPGQSSLLASLWAGRNSEAMSSRRMSSSLPSWVGSP
jgi:alpha-glucan,water dikinase